MVQRKWDAIHDFHGSWGNYVRDSLTTRKTTIFPIIMNDDARGDPMSFNAHPEHASWTEVNKPNCYPDSEIRNMRITLEITVPKALAAAYGNFRMEYALISCAFPEDLDALDEKSGLTLKEILEIQKESTDRQVYPLWSGIDMISGSLLHADIPALTTNQILEGVNFDPEVLLDQRRYGKVKGLIKKCMPIGYRKVWLSPRTVGGYTKRITLNFTPSNAKFINPYTFLGLLISCPQVAAANVISRSTQSVSNVDSTADTEFILIYVNVSYNERNPEFHMAKV